MAVLSPRRTTPGTRTAPGLVKGGGARLNEEVVKDEGYTVADSDVVDGERLMVGSGKKKKVVLKLV